MIGNLRFLPPNATVRALADVAGNNLSHPAN